MRDAGSWEMAAGMDGEPFDSARVECSVGSFGVPTIFAFSRMVQSASTQRCRISAYLIW